MDKSESEILEEWDLVSYDAEQEKNQTEAKPHIEQSEAPSDSTSETSSNNTPESILIIHLNNTPEISTNNTSENKADAGEKTSENGVDYEQKAHTDSVKTAESIVSKEGETVETHSKVETELHSEKGAIDEAEETAAEGDTEEMSEPDTEEITVIETIMYDVKKISDVDSEKSIVTNIENISSIAVKEGNFENSQETSDVSLKASDDTAVKECLDIKTGHEKERGRDAELKTDIINSSVEQPESSATLPGIYPVLTEQETASIESSSSDIDIIDENMEDSVSSSFLHPLSLSISSSVDTSNILTSSEDDKNSKIEDIRLPEKSDFHSIKPETHPKISEVYAEKTIPKQSHYDYQHSSDEKSENVHRQSRQHHREAHSNIFGAILNFLRNVKCLEWSLLGGVVISLCLTVVLNQTNIFAVIEKEDVVSQMRKMIDDLKYDNKLLKDQMLSEMKNEKVFSSFEHQIKELRKENSRLNHMLYDVAKVLEKQKDAHEKYEKKDDYLAPFKKEINKLKEQINNLKIDNEDLQKQLVRIRYASYSQGAKDSSDDKSKKKKEEIKTEETNSADEIPIDINSLKKWNELISLLSKELGLSLESDQQSKGKSYFESRKNISWYWKVFLRDFKGTFDEFKANITSKLSDYKKVQENTISDVYKFVKNLFTVEEQNQKFISPGEESSRWNNFGDFFNDLKDKWSKIKDRIDTSDLKNFFKDFKISGNEETPKYESQKPKSSPYEHNERKPTNAHFEPEKKSTNAPVGSDRKHDKAQKGTEDSEWMFERAALRAELRDTEKEDEVNWFLKKNKHLSEDDSEENKY